MHAYWFRPETLGKFYCCVYLSVCACVCTYKHGTCTCAHVSVCVYSVVCGLSNPNYAYGAEPGCYVSENADMALKLHFIALNQLLASLFVISY